MNPHAFIPPVLLSMMLFVPAFAQESPDSAAVSEGARLLSLIEEAETIPFSTGTVSQIITTSRGAERTLNMRMWSAENGDLSLMLYTDPPRVRGDKILQRDGGDNIWYYMRRRDTTRHFTGSARRQNIMGSDFSYEDLATGDLTEDYTAVYDGEEAIADVQCHRLICTPTDQGPSYHHLVLWASTEDLLTRKIDYYDDDGHLKTLFITDFQMVDGRKLGMRMTMENIRDGSRTVMMQDKMSMTEEPNASLFTKKALTREIP